MKNLYFLQKLFFLLVMGFSLSLVCACGDDEEDDFFDKPGEGITHPADSIPSGSESTPNPDEGVTVPTDSILSEETPAVPADSIPSEDIPAVPTDSIPVGDTPSVPADSIQDTPQTDSEVSKHPVAVDLGLSVKWATCNVGARSPEEFGGYYAWGEVRTKSAYSYKSYKWYDESSQSVTKYGELDGKVKIEPADDAARIEWGAGWRMPTLAEFRELWEECSWKWTELNGVGGYLVIGANGNSIFLPAAGLKAGNDFFDGGGLNGCYWSSSLDDEEVVEARCLSFSSEYDNRDDCWDNWNDRSYGLSIRPVSEY
jgi:hypothetical protein